MSNTFQLFTYNLHSFKNVNCYFYLSEASDGRTYQTNAHFHVSLNINTPSNVSRKCYNNCWLEIRNEIIVYIKVRKKNSRSNGG